MELIIAMGIVGILLTIAAPSMRTALMNVRISAQTNDLMADLALARSEAVKRSQGVFLCTSSDGATCNGNSWNQGWIVVPDLNSNNQWDAGELPLKARGPVEGNNTIVSRNHAVIGGAMYMPYRPTGITGRPEATFVICDSRTTPGSGRRINIGTTGRPQVDRVTCPLAP